MNKRQVIDEILTLNKTAKPAFLARFGQDDLELYLQQLLGLNKPLMSGDAARYQKYFVVCPEAAEIDAPAAELEPQVTVAQEAELISRTMFERAQAPAAEQTEPEVSTEVAQQVAQAQAEAQIEEPIQQQVQPEPEQAPVEASEESVQTPVQDVQPQASAAVEEDAVAEPGEDADDDREGSTVSGGYQYTYTAGSGWQQDDDAENEADEPAVEESQAQPVEETIVEEHHEELDEPQDQPAEHPQPVGASVSGNAQSSDKDNSDSWLF